VEPSLATPKQDIAPSALPADQITLEELQLAARNHGLPLEALRFPITPLGLHYLLIHYDIPVVDPGSWRLILTGRVRRELSLTLDDLRARSAVTAAVTMECAGNGRARLSPRPLSQPWLLEAVGTAQWTGTPLRPLLEDAGPLENAVEVLFSGLDRGVEGGRDQHYERSLPLMEALGDEVLLAYAINGQPLPPQHGFPLRLLVPGWYGMASVKWLHRITVLAEPFRGYQQTEAYRFLGEPDGPATPVTRMMPRALLLPPGVPDFMSRRRFLPLAHTQLEGRAWSGWGPVTRVEVSADGGGSWEDAELGQPLSPYAWYPWSYRWDPKAPGDYQLCCRASDRAGNVQPLEPVWNVKGYANNAVHRVAVTVTA